MRHYDYCFQLFIVFFSGQYGTWITVKKYSINLFIFYFKVSGTLSTTTITTSTTTPLISVSSTVVSSSVSMPTWLSTHVSQQTLSSLSTITTQLLSGSLLTSVSQQSTTGVALGASVSTTTNSVSVQTTPTITGSLISTLMTTITSNVPTNTGSGPTSSQIISQTTVTTIPPSTTTLQPLSFFLPNGSLDWTLVQTMFSSYTDDLTGCLVNCSNHGLCSVNTQNKLVCACFGSYVGSSCQADSRPCSTSPCLNNATCVDTYDSVTGQYSFTCHCDPFHYGANCQNEVDLCINETCSGNGRCVVNASFVPSCDCFQMFSGEHCELQSQSLKKVKQITSAASIIAILSIVITYAYVLLSDLHTFLTTPEKFLPHMIKKKAENLPKTVHIEYKN